MLLWLGRVVMFCWCVFGRRSVLAFQARCDMLCSFMASGFRILSVWFLFWFVFWFCMVLVRWRRPMRWLGMCGTWCGSLLCLWLSSRPGILLRIWLWCVCFRLVRRRVCAILRLGRPVRCLLVWFCFPWLVLDVSYVEMAVYVCCSLCEWDVCRPFLLLCFL